MILVCGKFLGALLCVISLGLRPALAGTAASPFEFVTPRVHIFHDVVNVGVVRSGGKALLIDSGDGLILQAGRKLGLPPIEWVLYTHHHRDQCSSAPLFKKLGVKLGVPAAESRFFRNATEFWLEADRIIDHRYDFRPDLFVLRDSVVPDREFSPGDVFNWEGVEIRVVATPGHTDGSISYILNIDGKRIAFTGDLIYGPGQLWEFYSLQNRFPGMKGDYWGFGGAVSDLEKSLDLVLSYQPAIVVPSHGLLITNPGGAVSALRKNLHAVMTNYLTLAAWRIYFKSQVNAAYDAPMFAPLPVPELPAWLHRSAETSWYIQADDKSIFLFDCGFEPIVRELRRLTRSAAISGIDGIWISHYHDDHLQAVNDIRREYGARVYAQKELQDILENPRAYLMPCLFPESIRVDHPLSEGEVIDWKGYRLTAYYFPGQTIYHDGLLVEHDKARIFMSGDSVANFGIDDYCSQNRNFTGNGLGYQRCLRLLLELKPDMLVAAHWGPVPISEEYLQKALKLLRERQALFSALFPWDDPNFGLDPYWARAYPYRQSVLPGQPVTVEARIYNHSGAPRQASVELRCPPTWKVGKADSITIAPHSEGKIRLSARAAPNPSRRREVLALAVRFGELNLGEIAEAIVDYLQ